MEDKIVIAMSKNAAFRIYAAVTTETVGNAQRIHNSFPVATAALGRTLTAASMMGAMIKNDNGSVTLQIKGDGPLGTIIAVGNPDGTVRGYASNPDVSLPPRKDGKIDVGTGVGRNGFINVVRDSGKGVPYTGNTQLVTGEIAEDLTSYFATSEQVPTAIGLGVSVDEGGKVSAAGGFMIQLMPGFDESDEKNISEIETRLGSMPAVTKMIRDGASPQNLIETIMGDIPFDILEEREVKYECKCSRDRVERAIFSMSCDDIKSLIDEGEAEVNCSFCDNKYKFSVEDLENLLDKKAKNA